MIEFEGYENMGANQMEEILKTVKAIQKTVECPICLDSLKDPVSVGCGHFFCKCCLLGILDSNYRAPCPLCKRLFTRRSIQDSQQRYAVITAVAALAEACSEHMGAKISFQRNHGMTNKKVADIVSPVTANESKRDSKESRVSASRKRKSWDDGSYIKDGISSPDLNNSPKEIATDNESGIKKKVCFDSDESCDLPDVVELLSQIQSSPDAEMSDGSTKINKKSLENPNVKNSCLKTYSLNNEEKSKLQESSNKFDEMFNSATNKNGENFDKLHENTRSNLKIKNKINTLKNKTNNSHSDDQLIIQEDGFLGKRKDKSIATEHSGNVSKENVTNALPNKSANMICIYEQTESLLKGNEFQGKQKHFYDNKQDIQNCDVPLPHADKRAGKKLRKCQSVCRKPSVTALSKDEYNSEAERPNRNEIVRDQLKESKNVSVESVKKANDCSDKTNDDLFYLNDTAVSVADVKSPLTAKTLLLNKSPGWSRVKKVKKDFKMRQFSSLNIEKNSPQMLKCTSHFNDSPVSKNPTSPVCGSSDLDNSQYQPMVKLLDISKKRVSESQIGSLDKSKEREVLDTSEMFSKVKHVVDTGDCQKKKESDNVVDAMDVDAATGTDDDGRKVVIEERCSSQPPISDVEFDYSVLQNKECSKRELNNPNREIQKKGTEELNRVKEVNNKDPDGIFTENNKINLTPDDLSVVHRQKRGLKNEIVKGSKIKISNFKGTYGTPKHVSNNLSSDSVRQHKTLTVAAHISQYEHIHSESLVDEEQALQLVEHSQQTSQIPFNYNNPFNFHHQFSVLPQYATVFGKNNATPKSKVVKRTCLTLEEIQDSFMRSERSGVTETIYSVPFLSGQFKLDVCVSDETLNISVLKVIDTATDRHAAQSDISVLSEKSIQTSNRVIQHSPTVLPSSNSSSQSENQNIIQDPFPFLSRSQNTQPALDFPEERDSDSTMPSKSDALTSKSTIISCHIEQPPSEGNPHSDVDMSEIIHFPPQSVTDFNGTIQQFQHSEEKSILNNVDDMSVEVTASTCKNIEASALFFHTEHNDSFDVIFEDIPNNAKNSQVSKDSDPFDANIQSTNQQPKPLIIGNDIFLDSQQEVCESQENVDNDMPRVDSSSLTGNKGRFPISSTKDICELKENITNDRMDEVNSSNINTEKEIIQIPSKNMLNHKFSSESEINQGKEDNLEDISEKGNIADKENYFDSSISKSKKRSDSINGQSMLQSTDKTIITFKEPMPKPALEPKIFEPDHDEATELCKAKRANAGKKTSPKTYNVGSESSDSDKDIPLKLLQQCVNKEVANNEKKTSRLSLRKKSRLQRTQICDSSDESDADKQDKDVQKPSKKNESIAESTADKPLKDILTDVSYSPKRSAHSVIKDSHTSLTGGVDIPSTLQSIVSEGNAGEIVLEIEDLAEKIKFLEEKLKQCGHGDLVKSPSDGQKSSLDSSKHQTSSNTNLSDSEDSFDLFPQSVPPTPPGKHKDSSTPYKAKFYA